MDDDMKIPGPKNTTQAAIYQNYEKQQDSLPRRHLGWSMVGRPCSRELWYSFRWTAAPYFSGKTLRLFRRGELEEHNFFIRELKEIGCEVQATDDSGNQLRVSDCGGHLAGSLDCVVVSGLVEAPTKKHVGEFKTSNEKSFRDLEKKGVKQAKPEHYTQMNGYMGQTGIDNAFYMVTNKNTDEIYTERLKFDPDQYQRDMEKAQVIIASDKPLPRISDDPTWYQCKWCDFSDVCHGGKPPLKNCRTCRHSAPITDGKKGVWQCNKWEQVIPPFAEKDGCPQHQLIPELKADIDPKLLELITTFDGEVVQ